MSVPQNQAWPKRRGVMELVFKKFLGLIRQQRQNLAEGEGIRGMEIGVWYGKGSTQIWLNLAPRDSEFMLIDSWKPFTSIRDQIDDTSFDYKEVDRLCTDAFMSAFLETKKIEMERSQDGLAITLLRGDSVRFLKYLQEGTFDFIYIDGDHKYENVKSDIKSAKRLINKEFGLICGDDLEKLPSKDLYELAKQHPERDCLRSPNGSFHPGVLAAIYEEFDGVNMFNGFWWIVMARGKFEPNLLKPIPPKPEQLWVSDQVLSPARSSAIVS